MAVTAKYLRVDRLFDCFFLLHISLVASVPTRPAILHKMIILDKDQGFPWPGVSFDTEACTKSCYHENT